MSSSPFSAGPAGPACSSTPYSRAHSHPHPYLDANSNSRKSSSPATPNANDKLPPHTTFDVLIQRNSLGFGFSIMGGADSAAPPYLIRVKKVFPLQPAWQTGQLRPGDILVRAGGLPLAGLTLRQALDILRSSPATITLSVSRPTYISSSNGNGNNSIQVATSPPPPALERPQVNRSWSYGAAENSARGLSLTSENAGNEAFLLRHATAPADNNNTTDSGSSSSGAAAGYGEFSVELRKVNGSLGFTLSRSDASNVLRHTVKALVKEPALSDGRIRPGDKLLSANNVDCDAMSHEELVRFLRRCPERLVLRLYRDASRSQTPVSPAAEPAGSSSSGSLTPAQVAAHFATSSSSSSHPRRTSWTGSDGGGSAGRHKQLRYEAQEMVRSRQASRTSLDKSSPVGSLLHRRMDWRSGSSSLDDPSSSVASGGGAGPAGGEVGPVVESPVTPQALLHESRSLPPLYLASSLERLRIEELSPTAEEEAQLDYEDGGGQVTELVEVEEEPWEEKSEETAPNNNNNDSADQFTQSSNMTRPSDLNLFAREKRKHRVYQFK